MISKDKYPSIFSRQTVAIMFIIPRFFFFPTRAILKIVNITRIFPSSSCGMFSHVMRLDQSRAGENIYGL